MKQVCGIWLPASDEHLAAEIERPINPLVAGKGTYQRNKYELAKTHTAHRQHAVDLGAHVGLWSRLMVMDFDRVTAFEPVAAHRACFERNVEGACLLPYAVGAKAGSICIEAVAEHTASAHVAAEGEKVEMVALDEFDFGPIDLLKIDIEGYEYEALLGGERTIRQARPTVIIEQKEGNAERYGRGQWDAVELLKRWGMVQVEVVGGDHVLVWPR